MATYYMDVNGSTLGFGTLDTITSNNQILTSTSALGNINTAAITFSSATTTNILSFGSLSTSASTTPGTLSTNSIGQQLAFNGLIFQGLTGTQTITYQGTTNGTLLLNGTSPFIEVTATGVLDIIRGVQGTTNWEKRGATTLRLRGANTFSGGMTISAGTVEVGSATALGNTAGSVTMTSGKLASWTTGSWSFANPLSLNGTMTFGDATNNGNLTFTGTTSISGVTALTTASNLFLTGVVSGANAWSKAGSAILRLTNANTFSQGLSISAGTIQIGNASALGTGTVTMTGGKLSSSSTTGYTVANALTLNGTMTLGDATNTGALAFTGALTLTGASTLTTSSGVTFAGAGTSAAAYNLSATVSAGLYFTGGAGTFTGGTATFTGSAVFLANFNSGTPNQLAGFSTLTFNSDAQINGNTAHTFANVIGGTGIMYVRNTSASGITFNGSMASRTASIRLYADSAEGANLAQKVTLTRADQFTFSSFWFQHDAGLTTLSQTLSYTGSDVVTNSKPLYVYGTSTSPTTVFSNNTSVAGTLVTFSNVVQTLNAVTTNFQIETITGPVTFSGVISNPNSGLINITKTGSSYEATLSGANTFTGTVTVSAGTLNANSTTALGSNGSSVSVTSGVTLSLGAAPTYTNKSLTIGGTGVSSTVGALVIANAGTNQFQSITLGSPTNYIRATNSGTIDAPFTSNNNSIIFGASAGSDFMPFLSEANVFSGLGSVTYGSHSGDTGIVRADVRHIYTGNTTLAYGTTYVSSSLEIPGTSGPLGNKSLTAANTLLMTGGTLSYLGGSTDYSGRFSIAGSQQWKIDIAGQTITYATALVGASSLSLSDTSTGGSLTLSSSASTFSSGVNLVNGTLNLGAQELKTGFGVPISGPLGLTGAITFTGGTLQYSSANQNDYSFRFSTNAGQQWKIDTNGQDVIFSSALTSTGGSLVKLALGTLTLAEANAYNSGTTLSVGGLKCGNVASLGTGGLAQANGTTLHVTATGGKLTIQGAHTNTGTGSRIIRIGA